MQASADLFLTSVIRIRIIKLPTDLESQDDTRPAFRDKNLFAHLKQICIPETSVNLKYNVLA